MSVIGKYLFPLKRKRLNSDAAKICVGLEASVVAVSLPSEVLVDRLPLPEDDGRLDDRAARRRRRFVVVVVDGT